MKYSVLSISLSLLVALSTPTLYAKNCETLVMVPPRILNAPKRIHQLELENAIDANLIRDELQPEVDQQSLRVSIDELAMKNAIDSIGVLEGVLSYLGDSFDVATEIEAALKELNFTFNPEIKISEQLRALKNEGKLNSKSKSKIDNFANKIAAIEANVDEMRNFEISVLSKISDGRSLTESLFYGITETIENLKLSLSTFESNRSLDQGFLDRAQQKLAEAQNRIAKRLLQIAAVHKEVADHRERVRDLLVGEGSSGGTLCR